MTLSLSKYLAGQIAEWLRGNAMAAAPTGLKFALSSTDPTYDGSSIAEPASPYARQSFNFGPVVPLVDASGNRIGGLGTTVANTSDIQFASTPSLTLKYAAVFDNSGNMLVYGSFPLWAAYSGLIVIPAGLAPLTLSGCFAPYLANAVLGWLRGVAMPNAPATVYAGVGPTAAGEASWAGYARHAVTWASKTQSGTTGTSITNTNTFEIKNAAAPAPTVTINYLQLYDAPVGGNLLASFQSPAPIVLPASDALEFRAGDVAIVLK